MSDSISAGRPGKIHIHLLDSSTGQSIQSWRFADRQLIRIGRSEENQIVITDPSVSRFHAELQYRGGHWQVVNFGKNGILIGGKSVSQTRIEDHMTFRLGSSGPLFRFGWREVKFEEMNTISGVSFVPSPAIKIDEAQKDLQVKEIAESEYFQKLQRVSQQLRSQTNKTETS